MTTSSDTSGPFDDGDDVQRRRELLRAGRKALGLNQAELAAQLGVGRETLSTWETRRAIPDDKWGLIAGQLREVFAYLRSAEHAQGIAFDDYQFLQEQAERAHLEALARDPSQGGRHLELVPMPNASAATALTDSDVQRIRGTLSPAAIGLALREATTEELASELVRRARGDGSVLEPLRWRELDRDDGQL